MEKKEVSKKREIDIKSLNTILKTSKKLVKLFYGVIIILLVLLATYVIKEWKILGFIGELLKVISPIFIGFFIAWLLVPLVDKLEKEKMPRTLACIIVYIILIAILTLIIYLIIPEIAAQIGDFVNQLPAIVKQITNWINNSVDKIGSGFNLNTVDIKEQIHVYFAGLTKDLTTNLPTTVFNIGKGIVSAGISIGLGLMIGFYMLFDYHKITKNIKNMVPVNYRDGFNTLLKRINNSLRKYLGGVLIVMCLVFVTQSIGLTLAGLEAPLIFALFCALTDIIPYFGPYIGAIPAVLVGFTISPLTGICVIIAIVIVQSIENYFYQPIIMGKTMSLHPVTIMIGLLIFEHFFGILGMVIATPAIACLKIIIKFINEKLHLTKKFIEAK